MLKKRLMSVGLALAMAVGMFTPALATETAEAQLEAQIEAEIQTMEDEIYADVYRQLEAQGQEAMMDIYVEILAPEIEARVRAKYEESYQPMSVQATNRYYAPNGGTIRYVQTGSLVEVVDTYMTPTQTQKLYNDRDDKITVMEVLTIVLGVVPGELSSAIAGGIALGVLLVDKIPSQTKQRIEDCGGYSRLLSTNDPVSGAKSNVLMEWADHPYASVDTSGKKDIKFYKTTT